MLKMFVLMMTGLCCVGARAEASWNQLRLAYDAPAAEWTDALPVGNGSLGAMVFGGIEAERIQFNHDTLWAGGPHSYSRKGAVDVLPQLRQLLFEGKQQEAEKLAMDQFMSQPLGQAPYQPFGDLLLDFPGHGDATGYRRELDLDGAVATTAYTVDGVTYTRSVFASHPDGLIAVRLEADQPGKLAFTARLSTPHAQSKNIGRLDGRTLRMTGVVDDHLNKRRGTTFEGQVRFEARLRAVNQGGTVEVTEGGIDVSGADSVVLYLAAETSYEPSGR